MCSQEISDGAETCDYYSVTNVVSYQLSVCKATVTMQQML